MQQNQKDRGSHSGEGSGGEPGLAEHSGRQDRKARQGADTAAALQEEATEPQHTGANP